MLSPSQNVVHEASTRALHFFHHLDAEQVSRLWVSASMVIPRPPSPSQGLHLKVFEAFQGVELLPSRGFHGSWDADSHATNNEHQQNNNGELANKGLNGWFMNPHESTPNTVVPQVTPKSEVAPTVGHVQQEAACHPQHPAAAGPFQGKERSAARLVGRLGTVSSPALPPDRSTPLTLKQDVVQHHSMIYSTSGREALTKVPC